MSTSPTFHRSSSAPSNFPSVSNIKFRFSLSNEKIHLPLARDDTLLLASDSTSVKHVNNFVIIRVSKIVFTIFHKSGHVNVSGVRDFSKIEEALRIFNDLFKTEVTEKKIIIDNTTSSGSLFDSSTSEAAYSKRIDLRELKRRVDLLGSEDISLSLRPHFFPGAVFRRRGKGTLIIFATGKFIIVGAKNRLQVREAHRALCAITRGMR